MRGAILRARRDLAPGSRRRFDAAIAAALAPLVRGLAVAGYVPLAGEPGGEDLHRVLREAARLVLPVLRDDLDLDWARGGGPLGSGRFGLREPTGPRLGVDGVANVSLVIVPAVAVDRRGVRLGRGGGSYDRALARVPAAVDVLAVLYPGELVDHVPAEPHDRPVGGVVTPDGLWRP